MADTNKIKYGIKNVYYAKGTLTSTGTMTYTTPVALPGAVSLSLSPEGETSPFYADNIVYYTSVSNSGYSGSLELAKVPDSFLKDCLGYIEDSKGVLLEDANATAANFALLFQFEGDAHAKRCVMYNCVAERPDTNGNTKEASISPETETINLTCTTIYNSVLDKDLVKASCTPAQTSQYENWLTAVYQTTTTA